MSVMAADIPAENVTEHLPNIRPLRYRRTNPFDASTGCYIYRITPWISIKFGIECLHQMLLNELNFDYRN
jgi:hypothetical protein